MPFSLTVKGVHISLGFFLLLVMQNSSAMAHLMGSINPSIDMNSTSDGYLISGWACENGNPNSIQVDLYVGGAKENSGSTHLGRFLADNPSEQAISTSCGSLGKKFRFSIPIPRDQADNYAGKLFYIYPISSTSAGGYALRGSGKYKIPPAGQIKIYLIDENGKALPPTTPGIVTTRIKKGGLSNFDAPVTVSNQRTTPDFQGTLAQTVLARPMDQVALGVYLPTGFEVLKKMVNRGNCKWDMTSVPHSTNLYADYSLSSETLIMSGPDAGSVCLAFMLRNKKTEYVKNEKTDSGVYGHYHENAFSSAMGLGNINDNQVMSLTTINSNSSEVTIDVSKTVGGVIQSLKIRKDLNHPELQLIKNGDIADSGFQWTGLLNGVLLPGQSNSDPAAAMIFNQAVGGDPTWMWGMEMPLQPLNDQSNILQTKPGTWVPLYSDMNSTEPVENQWDLATFSPRSPLFRPLSSRLFDGRVEGVSNYTLGAPGHKVSRITTTFRSRSHFLNEFSADMKRQGENQKKFCCTTFKRFEWMAFDRDLLLQHHAKIYYGDDQGKRWSVGSLNSNAWPQRNSKCYDSKTNMNYSTPCGLAPLSNVRSISIVLDPGNQEEQVLSIHLPKFQTFNGVTSFTSWNHSPNLPSDYWTNSTFLVVLNYFDTGNNPFVFKNDYDVSDTFEISIGADADLKILNPGLGK